MILIGLLILLWILMSLIVVAIVLVSDNASDDEWEILDEYEK